MPVGASRTLPPGMIGSFTACGLFWVVFGFVLARLLA